MRSSASHLSRRSCARKVGRVILNTATDQPWSHYLCCVAFGNREFVRAHPVATKRYLRAVLKAADLCATDPERAAQRDSLGRAERISDL
jgi:NitT/TauT family transport system substrate-binding protein